MNPENTSSGRKVYTKKDRIDLNNYYRDDEGGSLKNEREMEQPVQRNLNEQVENSGEAAPGEPGED